MLQQLVTPTSVNFGFEPFDQPCDLCQWLSLRPMAHEHDPSSPAKNWYQNLAPETGVIVSCIQRI